MTIPIHAPRWLTPVTAAFAGSLLLSLVARLGSTINRDGMLYINAAQAFLDGGFAAAKAVFAWPFLSIGIAIVSKLTGLGLENAGYLLNALFMAGACVLMVACTARRSPALAWWACLTVLALPGFNEYRNELLREFGCWFFVMLACWLALRWEEQPRWPGALAIQVAVVAAALFRPEAVALFPALLAWQLFAAPRGQRARNLAMVGALPLIGCVVVVLLFISGKLGPDSRLATDLGRLSTARFDAKADVLASGLIEYARGQARTILLFGSLALIPVKLFQKFGIFLLPLAGFLVAGDVRAAVRRHAFFVWGIAAHLCVLAIFVIDLQFLAGRYVGLILLLATPFVAAGLQWGSQRFRHAKAIIIVLCLVLAAGNVISTGAGKAHHVEAGKWLANSGTDVAQVYIDSGRTAYHAGWAKAPIAARNNRVEIERAAASRRYEFFVLEISRKDPPWESWLRDTGLQVVQRFEIPNGDAVVVAIPREKESRQ